ncbi:hypothetical protein AC249_AIPGENE5753 [Exaiptasia diaphana]|nr:hypothetical protein AC249_AIPGENE5753 [Exaiptasia diaphana]
MIFLNVYNPNEGFGAQTNLTAQSYGLKGHCQWMTCAVTVSPLTDFESITFECPFKLPVMVRCGRSWSLD